MPLLLLHTHFTLFLIENKHPIFTVFLKCKLHLFLWCKKATLRRGSNIEVCFWRFTKNFIKAIAFL